MIIDKGGSPEGLFLAKNFENKVFSLHPCLFVWFSVALDDLKLSIEFDMYFKKLSRQMSPHQVADGLYNPKFNILETKFANVAPRKVENFGPTDPLYP